MPVAPVTLLLQPPVGSWPRCEPSPDTCGDGLASMGDGSQS